MAAQAGGEPGVKELAKDGALAGRWNLDTARVEFANPNFWGLATVRGWFDKVTGSAEVAPDGAVTGELVMDAASLNTKNAKRDVHLRSSDFFDAEKHPQVRITVAKAALTDSGQLAVEGTMTAAGVTEPLAFTADVTEASPTAVSVRGTLTLDRSRFGMTWAPMKMASYKSTGTVTARFTRAAG